MKKSKKYVSLALAGMLALGTLAGCGKSSTQSDVAKETACNVDVLVQYDTKPEEKLFEPGEHTFTILVATGLEYKDASMSYEPVEGYQVISTAAFSRYYYSSYFYVTYQNTEPVMVKPVWNPELSCYDYTQFGEVLSYENTEEETHSLTK